jgi:predicted nucleotidyltransferase component of viral defense system
LASVTAIRKADSYGGYRASVTAVFDIIRIALKIDLTTGDKITLRESLFRFALMFEDRYIDIMAYNPEMILAEKYETIMRRSMMNTRMRDFYDVYTLINFQAQNIDRKVFQEAVKATAIARESSALLADADTILNLLADDATMQSRWALYQKEFSYARDIPWKDIVRAVRAVREMWCCS